MHLSTRVSKAAIASDTASFPTDIVAIVVRRKWLGFDPGGLSQATPKRMKIAKIPAYERRSRS